MIDTGLRNVQFFNVTLAQAAAAAAAGVSAVLQPIQPGYSQKLLLQVWEDDFVTPAAVLANVSWSAVGK
jgi:hypothetical protein